jgi:hypothetical protein
MPVDAIKLDLARLEDIIEASDESLPSAIVALTVARVSPSFP